MKMSLMILSTILISGCQFPRIEPQEQCVLSLEFNKCRCRMYEISEERVGGVPNTGVDHELSYCNNMVGYRSSAYAELTSWLNAVWEYVRDMRSE